MCCARTLSAHQTLRDPRRRDCQVPSAQCPHRMECWRVRSGAMSLHAKPAAGIAEAVRIEKVTADGRRYPELPQRKPTVDRAQAPPPRISQTIGGGAHPARAAGRRTAREGGTRRLDQSSRSAASQQIRTELIVRVVQTVSANRHTCGTLRTVPGAEGWAPVCSQGRRQPPGWSSEARGSKQR